MFLLRLQLYRLRVLHYIIENVNYFFLISPFEFFGGLFFVVEVENHDDVIRYCQLARRSKRVFFARLSVMKKSQLYEVAMQKDFFTGLILIVSGVHVVLVFLNFWL